MARAIDVFSEWAKEGKSEKMADGHALAVDNMLNYSVGATEGVFSFVDAGCGNGWVVRKMLSHPRCDSAVGIDASTGMIDRAKQIDPNGNYLNEDLLRWAPKQPVDLVHSMEVFYYFREPQKVINHVVENWLASEGRLIIGVDHYRENEASLGWAEKYDIDFMTTLSIEQWCSAFADAGLKSVSHWLFEPRENWSGTLVVTGQKA